MKNITQYFVDNVKSSANTTISSNNDTVEESDSKKNADGKRNRVKIKISRTNAQERVCDIVDNNSDMIDKTPSPFTGRIGDMDKNFNETPKRSSLSKLSSGRKHKKLRNQNLDYLSLETTDVFDGKSNEQSKKNNSGNSLSKGKRSRRESRSEKYVKGDININNSQNNEKDIVHVDLGDSDSNDRDKNNSEGSNAFQILMSRTKPTQISPKKLVPQNEETNAKKSEEYREKLKRSKERLTILADKKGYSKRKLSEIEEGEKIEEIIQNRIKAFKVEGKKDDNMNATVLSQKQPPGSLLNYFSKTPVDVMHENMKDMSTIVVKADVHMSENSVKQNLLGSQSKNKIKSVKKNRSNIKFPGIDDITVVGSENISHNKQENSKHKWSLRIKLQNYENEDSISGYSSDEEIFSPRSKARSGTENHKKSKIPKRLSPENISVINKNKNRSSKPANENSKLKLKKQKQENSEENIKMQNDERLETESDDINNVIKSGKRKSISVHKKDVNKDINNVNTNLGKAKQVGSNEEDCVILTVGNLKRKTADKLAPLFIKRQKPDPETVAARRLFLQSDITDKSNKNVDQKINAYNTLPFPVISHVTQLNNLDVNKTNGFNILEKVSDQYVPSFNVNNYKFIMNFSEVKSKPSKSVIKPKVQEVLTEIERNCSDVRKMWNIISLTVKEYSDVTVSPKVKTRKNKTGKKEVVEQKIKDQIENYCWTYKYRPRSSEEVVGNEEAAGKLKEWLTGWRATFTNEDVNTSDEFYSTDCSSDTKIIENNQVAVLLGPCGSGKTASVYAVAEEFGYTVLEVNASSKRNGKKLLKEFEEATKSHRIIKEKNSSMCFNSASDEILPKRIPQNSLILLEDVDLVFEEDEGFISATYQLASNTKRPIVMTCRDVYPQLIKMAPQQNRIYFQRVIGNRVFALLELISLAETGYRLPPNCITELTHSGDLRKAILQLQYLLSSPTQVVDHSIHFNRSFWQNMRYYLYKPAIKVSKRQKSKKTVNSKMRDDNQDILSDVAKKLDNIALLSSLVDIEDSVLNLKEIKVQASLSLTENTNLYSSSNNICFDIAEWISKKIMLKDQSHEYERSQYQINVLLQTKLNKGVNLALSQATSSLLDRQIVSTDYLPSVRAICRAEESRANMNNKRGNRFFHYLHSLKVPSTSLKPNILMAACKIMHEKIDYTSSNENTTPKLSFVDC